MEKTRDSRTIPETISLGDRKPLLRAAMKHNDLAPKNGKRRSDVEIHEHQHHHRNATVATTLKLMPISFEIGKKREKESGRGKRCVKAGGEEGVAEETERYGVGEGEEPEAGRQRGTFLPQGGREENLKTQKWDV
ncbi:hypothetical protein RHMOL_Rhmol11G0161800 [Rhododendron molle]|uniref:Uncharacterized protein n=1 Tax=Rhododendron molle TaxID=49168 RepID=A0ACC0LT53_RHOML|nr:hypothetical protein RHMOL_Rhmol11G0161800 [Rhododendron molle]